MKIKVLDDNLVNRIAAGEVVERPASVVRELVDNAIDAGATDVSVWLERGGRSLLRVVDNGSGMGRDDALLAFDRHATSKLQQAEDLEAISTLGFRGEALSSIAAVGRVSLKTRPAESDSGTLIVIEGGKIRDVQSVSAPLGTAIEVRRLFFNTPARRKFLRQPATEERRAKAWLRDFALAHPDVRFRMFADGKEIINFARRPNTLARARECYRGSLVEFQGEREEMRVEGLVGHPSMAQYDSGSLVLLVNGRPVSDRMLSRAVRDGFESTLKAREYPVGCVRLDLDPHQLDVNVHPQKTEVRFRDSQIVFSFIREQIRQAVKRFRQPVQFDGGQISSSEMSERSRDVPSPHSEPAWKQQSAPLCAPGTERKSSVSHDQEHEEMSHEVSQDRFRFSDLRYIGQLLSCYLLCEYDERFFVVDMHAAHERYNYNLIRNSYTQRRIDSQALLVPLSVELTEKGVERLLSWQALLEQVGFEVEEFGLGTVVVRAVPAILADHDVKEIVLELAAIAGEEEAPEAVEGVYEQAIDRIAARIACHASIRSGKKMEREEVYALFESLDRSEFSAACPHGRPVVVSFEEADVEKWFGRDR